jgi:hypothetical protein
LYTGKDHTPVQGKNYYRIKQVDFNGTVHYSHIAIVSIDAKGAFSIAPNPVTDIAQVAIPSFEGLTELRILDMQGREVYSTSVPAGTTKWALSSEGFAAGVYFLEISQHGALKRIRFMK